MSLQSADCPGRVDAGSAKLPFGAPVFRSNIFTAVGVLPAGTWISAHVISVEQTNKGLDRSSASTPTAEDKPLVPGLIHSFACVSPGAALKMRPPARLLKNSVPSDDAVTLSGKSVVPGTTTSAAQAPPAMPRTRCPGLQG